MSNRNRIQEDMRVLVAELRTRVELLPPAGVDALALAGEFWAAGESRPTPDALDEARVRCWEFLDAKHGNSTDIVDNEARAVRALLTVLHPDRDTDALADSIEWFWEMIQQIDVASAD